MARLSLPIVVTLVLVSTGPGPQAAETAAAPNGDFMARQASGLWRASKLVGVTIYGPGDQKVGSIDDVLLARDGKASIVVIGVGGFLGLGEKHVAVPYDRVSFSQEPVRSIDAQPLPTGLGAPAATTGPGTGATLLPGPSGSGSTSTPPTVIPQAPRTTAYPDHGTVTYTADQLKAAPAFRFDN